MDLLVVLVAGWMWSAVTSPGVIAPKTVPAVVVANWQVKVQDKPHPYETRLRQVEVDNIRSAAYAKQATDEAKEIIKDRTARLVELEQWKRDWDRERAERSSAKTTAEDAKSKADEVDKKLQDRAVQIDVASPWSWQSLVASLGGTAGVGMLAGALFKKVSNLRKELEVANAIPGPNNQAIPQHHLDAQSGRDDRVMLNARPGDDLSGRRGNAIPNLRDV